MTEDFTSSVGRQISWKVVSGRKFRKNFWIKTQTRTYCNLSYICSPFLFQFHGKVLGMTLVVANLRETLVGGNIKNTSTRKNNIPQISWKCQRCLRMKNKYVYIGKNFEISPMGMKINFCAQDEEEVNRIPSKKVSPNLLKFPVIMR